MEFVLKPQEHLKRYTHKERGREREREYVEYSSIFFLFFDNLSIAQS